MNNQEAHFTFSVSTLEPDTFHVVRFTGTEGLSRLYQFDLTLLSENASVDFGKALSGTAKFTIKRQEGGDLVWHGILRDFQQLQMADKHVIYRAVLVPKAWQLTLTRHNQIFLDQDVTQNISQCLSDGGLSQGLDFELSASHSYDKREYVCQYNETHFNFASRWMERNGFYFFFDQSGQQEKLEVTDSLNVHNPHPGGDTLTYAEQSGLDADIVGKAAKNFRCEQRRLPREVLLKDYNYQTPSLDIQGKALVSQDGSGTVYTHGGHLRTVSEATSLADLRAQGFKCREQVFFGESNAPFLQPGYVTTLEKHYRDSFNQKYLLIEVKHEGAQESWLVSGMGAAGLGDRLFYRNAFAAIPAGVQFRSELTTPKPLIDGALKAVIDAEGSGQYAELDDQGRYKVIMPFDLSGRNEGHASTWLRMIQPYAGQNHGMHFPLHKGTEVAVIHYEGDPDQPVIAGAVPNPETPSMVTSGNQTMANITSAGGNLIHIQDQQGSERILLHSTAKGDYIRIGAHNDPASFSDVMSEMANDGINLTTPQWFNVKAEFANQIVLADNTQTTLGVYSCNAIGANITFIVGMSITTNCAVHTEFSPVWKEMRASVQEAATQKDQIYADLLVTVGQHTTTIGQHDVTIGQHTQTIGQHDNTIGQHTQTIGQHDNTIGQHTQTIGQHDQTIGQHTLTIGQHDQTIGQHTLTIGQHDQTIGQHTQTIGELEQNAGEITSMAADVSNLWGVVSVVAGEVGFV